jgi:hypothetical protein
VSSTPYGAPLELLVRPSRLTGLMLCVMHTLAALVCLPLPLTPSYRIGLLLAILLAFVWNLWTFMRRTPKRVHWSPEEGWNMTDRAGVEHALKPQPEAYIGGWLVVAYFKDEAGKRRTVMIAQDSVSGDGFRRLKVLLRYGTPRS